MIVDVAHLAKPGFWQVMEVARGPILGSHCVTWGEWHRLDDDQLRAVARAGGVVCTLAYNRPSLAAVVEAIRHIADVAGVDHVGFGADYFGLDRAPVGLEDTTKYPALTAALLQAGFAASDVGQIMGGNLLRVFESLGSPQRSA
jgi:membrane dipeptidase